MAGYRGTMRMHIENPSALRVSAQITMELEDWRRLAKDLSDSGYPNRFLKNLIDKVIAEAEQALCFDVTDD